MTKPRRPNFRIICPGLMDDGETLRMLLPVELQHRKSTPAGIR